MLPHEGFGWIYEVTMRWQTPVISVIFYLLSVVLANRHLVTLFVVIHNALLTAFSALVAYKTVVPFITNVMNVGLLPAFMDDTGEYRSAVLNYWSFIFYLSKYYELLDSAILIAKGRPISFLQAFHHAGIIPVMWAATSVNSSATFSLTGFNSVIHTIMYPYYMMAALKIRIPCKQMITILQILQFIVGWLSGALFYAFSPKSAVPPAPQDYLSHALGCRTAWEGERYAFFLTMTYLTALLVLFISFYRQTYKPNNITQPETTKTSRTKGTKNKMKKQ